ncbi:MAG: molybdopterin molybdotransferase MoeA [bacterium]
MKPLTALDKAGKIIRENIKFKTEIIETQNSLGYFTASKIISPEDFPSFDRALFDGYALNSKKTGNAGGRYIAPKKISTGQILPDGTDCVLMLEDAIIKNGRLIINEKIEQYKNVIRKGEDFKKGEVIFKKVHKLRPQDVALLLGLGIKKIKVYKKVSFGIIASGNEIVPFNKKPGYGQVRDMNSGMMMNLVKSHGGDAEFLGICPDRSGEILKFIKGAKKFDAILFCGATSVGARDILEPALLKFPGCKMLFHGLRIRPGKPALAAKMKNQLIIGIPGRPSSGFVVFNLLVKPVLNYFSENDKKITALLNKDLRPRTEIEEYVPVKLVQKNNIFYAEPVIAAHSSFSPYIHCHGLMRIPAGVETIGKGEKVEITII